MLAGSLWFCMLSGTIIQYLLSSTEHDALQLVVVVAVGLNLKRKLASCELASITKHSGSLCMCGSCLRAMMTHPCQIARAQFNVTSAMIFSTRRSIGSQASDMLDTFHTISSTHQPKSDQTLKYSNSFPWAHPPFSNPAAVPFRVDHTFS